MDRRDLEPDHGHSFWRLGKKAAGHLLDGVVHQAFPSTTDGMSTLELTREQYAALVDAPLDDVEPIPAIAPARGTEALLPFQLALPDGCGNYIATFDVDREMWIASGLVRYGQLKPVAMPFRHGVLAIPGDTVEIMLHGRPQSVGG